MPSLVKPGRIALILAMAFSACISVPGRASTADDRRRVEAEVKRKLKDGESARFLWPKWTRDDTIYCGWVNAKNSYGGYTGYKLFYAQLTKSAEGSISNVLLLFDDDNPGIVESSCANFGYDISEPPLESAE